MTSHLERVSTPGPTLTRSGDRTAPLQQSTVACVVLWLVFRLYQIALGCSGEGTDVELYRAYAGNLRSGAAAAVDFQPEYPPGALTVFLLPALGGERYGRGFVVLTALFDLGACLLVFHRARLRQRDGASLPVRPRATSVARTPFFHASLYLLMTAALWPVLYARFDIVPAALVFAALHCLDRHRERAAAAILGAAGAVKLWPFALFPLWVAFRGGGPRRPARQLLASVATTGAWMGAGVAIAVLPVLPLIGYRVGSSLRYHAARGLQIESTWASAVLALERLGLTEARVEEAFGSVQLAGSLPEALARLSLPATLALAALPAIVAIATAARRRSLLTGPESPGRAPIATGGVLETAVLATTLGVMIASKVLSPQFVLWVVPLLALTVEGVTGFLLAFLVAALTTQVYPYLYPALMDQAPGGGRALMALLARNALLVGWYVHAVRRLAKQGAPADRLLGGDGTLEGLVLPLRPRGRERQGR